MQNNFWNANEFNQNLKISKIQTFKHLNLLTLNPYILLPFEHSNFLTLKLLYNIIMKIGIDVTMLVYAGSGVANYTYNLVKNLLLIDKKNKYLLFYSSLRRPSNFYYLDELKKLGAIVYEYPFPPSLLRMIWGKLNIVPIDWFTGRVDAFFFSDFLRPPINKNTRGVTTIHDLTWKLFPEYHTSDVIIAHEKKLKKTIENKDTIIVDSESTKNDLLRLYPVINKNNIHVIYPGVGEEFRQIKDKTKIEEVLKKYLPKNFKFNLPAGKAGISNFKFILYVGAIEPRKNLELSIRVFHKLLTDHPGLLTHFFIAGRAGWKNEKVFQLVKDLKLEDKVIFLGFVEDADLPYLYNACSLNIYLSEYEGFGLPPLEALSCEAKTIVGDNSSLKETINEKYRVNLNSEDKIVEKIIKILNDKTTVTMKKFTWADAAQKFLQVITK